MFYLYLYFGFSKTAYYSVLFYTLPFHLKNILLIYYVCTFQFSSVAQSCPAFWNPKDCSTLGFPENHQLPEPAQLTSIKSVMPSNHFILYCPLLFLPSVFPSKRVFFQMSQFFASSGQSIGISVSVFLMNIQD